MNRTPDVENATLHTCWCLVACLPAALSSELTGVAVSNAVQSHAVVVRIVPPPGCRLSFDPKTSFFKTKCQILPASGGPPGGFEYVRASWVSKWFRVPARVELGDESGCNVLLPRILMSRIVKSRREVSQGILIVVLSLPIFFVTDCCCHRSFVRCRLFYIADCCCCCRRSFVTDCFTLPIVVVTVLSSFVRCRFVVVVVVRDFFSLPICFHCRLLLSSFVRCRFLFFIADLFPLPIVVVVFRSFPNCCCCRRCRIVSITELQNGFHCRLLLSC